MADPKIRYDIEAQARGSEEVRQLTGELSKLDRSIDPAVAQRAKALDEEIRRLGESQVAVRRFQELSAALGGARDRLSTAQAGFKALQTEIAASAEPTAKQAAQLTKLGEAVGKAKDDVTRAATAYRAGAATLGEYGVAVGATVRAFGGVSKAETELQAQTQKLQGSIGALVESMRGPAQVAADRNFLGVESHRKAQKEIDATRAAFDRLKTSGQLSSAEIAQAALKADEKIRALRESTNGWAESLGRAKSAAVGVAAAGAGLVAVANAAVSFETAMSDVRKVVDGTPGQIAALGDELKRLSSKELPLAASELAKIAAAGGQIGVPIEKLTEFTRLAAQMATAFDLGADKAGEAVAKLGNNFSLPLEGVRQLGDAINVLGNTTAAKEKDIVEVLTRVGGSAKQFGLTAEQVAALASSFLSLGSTAETTATGINAMLSRLQTAAAQTPEFRAALAGIGVSAQRLGDDIQAHPQKALVEFLRTLNRLDGQTRSQVLVKLFGLEYQDDIARLLGSLGAYEKALGQVGDKTATAGSMQREFATRSETAANRIQLLKNSLDDLAITLGDMLLPLIKGGVDGLRDITSGAAEFAKAHPAITAVAGGIVTAASAMAGLRLAVLAGGVVATKVFGDLLPLAGGLAKPIGEATAAVGKLQTAVAVLGAGVLGWEVGTYLRNEFKAVEVAGVAMVTAVMRIAERAQTTFEQVKALATGGSLAEVEREHLARVQEIDRAYQDMMDAAIEGGRQQQQATAGAATAAGEAAAAAAGATGAMGAAGAATTGVATAAGDAGKAMGGFGAAAQDAGAKAVAAGGAAAAALASAARLPEMLTKAATDLGVNLQALGAGLNAELDKSQRDFAAVIGSLDQFRAAGVDTGRLVAQAMAGMVNRAATEADIRAIDGTLLQMGATGKLSAESVALGLKLAADKAEELRAAIETSTPGIQSLAEAARAAGVEVALLTGGLTKDGQAAVETLGNLVDQVVKSGVEAKRASPVLADALDKRVEAAKTTEEVTALIAQLVRARTAGKEFGEGFEAALTKARAKLDELRPGINSVAEAAKKMGVETRDSLRGTAEQMGEAWRMVRDSGQFTVSEQIKAFEKYKAAAVAASGGVVTEQLKVDEAILRTRSQAAGLGDEFERSMGRGKSAADQAIQAFDELGRAVDRNGAVLNPVSGFQTTGRGNEATGEAPKVDLRDPQQIAARNAAMSESGSILAAGLAARRNEKSGTIGSTYTPPPDNSGDWEWVSDISRGGVWKMTAEASAREASESAAAVEAAYAATGAARPTGMTPFIGPGALPAEVKAWLLANGRDAFGGDFGLRGSGSPGNAFSLPKVTTAPSPAPAPAPSQASTTHYVTVTLPGGAQRTVNAATAGDASALANLLRELENSATVAQG